MMSRDFPGFRRQLLEPRSNKIPPKSAPLACRVFDAFRRATSADPLLDLLNSLISDFLQGNDGQNIEHPAFYGNGHCALIQSVLDHFALECLLEVKQTPDDLNVREER